MTDDEAQAIAKHFEIPLTQCWASAFDDYSQLYGATRHMHSPRSRASLLHDHCIHHIQLLCSGNPDITFPPKRQGLVTVPLSGKPLGIDGILLGRFKKLNQRLLASNIQTQQTRDFNDQQPMGVQGELFGFPLVEREPPHINIGYLPDKFWMSMEAVYATMPNGSHALQWFVQLSDGRDTQSTPIIDMPVTPATPTQRRVTPKVAAADDKKTGTEQ